MNFRRRTRAPRNNATTRPDCRAGIAAEDFAQQCAAIAYNVRMFKWTVEADRFLRAKYAKLGPAEIAELLGTTARRVARRRYYIGADPLCRPWKASELKILREWYSTRRASKLELPKLAKLLKRSEDGITIKAGRIGVSFPARKPGRKLYRKWPTDEESLAAIRNGCKNWKNGHPRGMLGNKHKPEVVEQWRKMMKERYASMSSEEVKAIAAKGVATKLSRYGKAGGFGNASNAYSRCKRGRRGDLGGMFFRSSWEANYARYLKWLKSIGEIAGWEHEPDNFRFEGVKRGPYTYLPDFKVIECDGSVAYHEVKGWMDAKSRSKIKRMKKFFPNIRLVVIAQKEYTMLAKKVSACIPFWE